MDLYSGYQQRKCRFKRIIFLLVAVLMMPHGAQALVILQYHHVSTEMPAATSISPEQFAAHMQRVAQSGYRVVSLPEVLKALRENTSLPDKAVLITFDDGSQSLMASALPVLKKYKWPFVVFISTEPVSQRQKATLSWDELRELAAHGAAIANHSVSHSHMIRLLPGETRSQWRQRMRREIVDAEAKIEMELGQSHRAFAYPYGEFSAPLVALVSELGFVGFGQHSGAPTQRDIATLPRFPFGGVYVALDDFALKLQSLPLPFGRIRMLNQRGEVLQDGVLSNTDAIPIVQFEGLNPEHIDDLACYVSRQGVADKLVDAANLVRFQAKNPLLPGRTRYNCTVVSNEPGRFYWHSSPFIKANSDGSWAPEPP